MIFLKHSFVLHRLFSAFIEIWPRQSCAKHIFGINLPFEYAIALQESVPKVVYTYISWLLLTTTRKKLARLEYFIAHHMEFPPSAGLLKRETHHFRLSCKPDADLLPITKFPITGRKGTQSRSATLLCLRRGLISSVFDTPQDFFWNSIITVCCGLQVSLMCMYHLWIQHRTISSCLNSIWL